jgi:hypothetical protein
MIYHDNLGSVRCEIAMLVGVYCVVVNFPLSVVRTSLCCGGEDGECRPEA